MQTAPYVPILSDSPRTPGGTQFSKRPAGAIDDLLVDACSRGEWNAFDELVSRHHQQLLRVALRLTRNKEDAQDAVQEAFLKVFQKLYQFQGNAQFSTWLFRIIVNESRMKLRGKSWTNTVSLSSDLRTDDPGLLSRQSNQPSPEELCHTSELREILAKTGQNLSPRLRSVFILRDLHGFSIEETANILGLHQSAVKSRLRRAHIQLRGRLSHRLRFPQRLEFEFRPPANPQLQRRPSHEFSSY